MQQLKFLSLAIVLAQLVLVQGQYNAAEYKTLVIPDNSNDDAIELTPQELLTRSGFQFEKYYVTADDGYISSIIRIINPLADKTKLRYPPIMMLHGGLIDQSCYLFSSSIQHHPEKYPRTVDDGPITSSNRSLGFFLANNGYDVFLVGTRGSNLDNQAHYRNAAGEYAVYNGNNTGKNMTAGETKYEYDRTPYYFQYGQDDVTVHELRVQIDTVRNITNSTEFSMFTYSLSAPTTVGFLGLYPEYAKDCRIYTQMAPAFVADHENNPTDALYFGGICSFLPTRASGVAPVYIGNPLLSTLLFALSEPYTLRYTAAKSILNALLGPSPMYQTNIERNVIARVLQPVSFKTIQQYCQGSISKKFRKFDYGPVMNLKLYDQIEPPEYNPKIDVQNYVVVQGTSDGLASPNTIQNIINLVKTKKPPIVITAQLYNHLDMVAGVKNDLYVNHPLLKVFNELSD